MKTLTLFLALVTMPTLALASVSVGGITYTLVSDHAASTVGPEFMEQHADGEYIVIRLTVHNDTNRSILVSAEDFHLKRGGTEYDAADVSAYLDGNFFLTTINPGVSRTGSIAFDVPADTSPLKYQLEVYGNGGVTPHLMGL